MATRNPTQGSNKPKAVENKTDSAPASSSGDVSKENDQDEEQQWRQLANDYLNTQVMLKLWIEEVLEKKFEVESERTKRWSLQPLLKNGVIICELMRKIRPKSIPFIHNNPGFHQFKIKENVTYFTSAVETIGVARHKLFQPNDLIYDGYNFYKVIECLQDLAFVAGELGLAIHLKQISFQDCEWSEEQISAAQNELAALRTVKAKEKPNRRDSAVTEFNKFNRMVENYTKFNGDVKVTTGNSVAVNTFNLKRTPAALKGRERSIDSDMRKELMNKNLEEDLKSNTPKPAGQKPTETKPVSQSSSPTKASSTTPTKASSTTPTKSASTTAVKSATSLPVKSPTASPVKSSTVGPQKTPSSPSLLTPPKSPQTSTTTTQPEPNKGASTPPVVHRAKSQSIADISESKSAEERAGIKKSMSTSSITAALLEAEKLMDGEDEDGNTSESPSRRESANSEVLLEKLIESNKTLKERRHRRSLIRQTVTLQSYSEVIAKRVEQALKENPKAVTTGVIKLQALVRGRIARRLYQKRVTDNAYRKNVAQEILETEKIYLNNLHLMLSIFHDPLMQALKEGKPILKEKYIKSMFSGSINVIIAYNTKFMISLEPRIRNWTVTQRIGDVFLEFTQFLKAYTSYVKDFPIAQGTLDATRTKNKFASFLLECKKRTELQQQDLSSLLILPVQRIPRYVLLLNDLLRRTWKDHIDYEDLTNALKSMQETAAYINERKRESESIAKIWQIQSRIGNLEWLGDPQLRFLREDLFGVYDTQSQKVQKDRVILLFNDKLVLTKPVMGSKKKIKVDEMIDLLKLQISKADRLVSSYPPDSIVLTVTHGDGLPGVLVLVAGSSGEKETWVNTFIKSREELDKNLKRQQELVLKRAQERAQEAKQQLGTIYSSINSSGSSQTGTPDRLKSRARTLARFDKGTIKAAMEAKEKSESEKQEGSSNKPEESPKPTKKPPLERKESTSSTKDEPRKGIPKSDSKSSLNELDEDSQDDSSRDEKFESLSKSGGAKWFATLKNKIPTSRKKSQTLNGVFSL